MGRAHRQLERRLDPAGFVSRRQRFLVSPSFPSLHKYGTDPSPPLCVLYCRTLLKSDQWHQAVSSSEGLRGAVGFRRIPDSNLFAVGQPTQDAVGHVIEAIEKITHGCEIVWLNLREVTLLSIRKSDLLERD
jgi:hypothetical protein